MLVVLGVRQGLRQHTMHVRTVGVFVLLVAKVMNRVCLGNRSRRYFLQNGQTVVRVTLSSVTVSVKLLLREIIAQSFLAVLVVDS